MQMVPVEGSEETLPCQLLLIAAGFLGAQSYVAESFGVELSPRGVVQTRPGHYATNLEGVFTAGDMHRGQSLVVWGIAEGRACAREVDEYLMGYTCL
jgi:glutamate synthase (NADPH/NADH) small chain